MMDLETFLILHTGKSLKRWSPTQGCSTNGRRRRRRRRRSHCTGVPVHRTT